jgi:hypothetical protein
MLPRQPLLVGAPDINDRSDRLPGLIGLSYDFTRSALGLFAAFTMRPTSASSVVSCTSLASVSRNSFLGLFLGQGRT